MDDQTSWKGHSFTLLIFGGVVILSSIFFILAMLVGRTQAEPVAADPEELDKSISTNINWMATRCH